ncbi:MAG: hypothetical protein MZU91_00320 [Desulfosudis oleivorans]|nr:hypothetical protein [Desulfosudis oleivorans]
MPDLPRPSAPVACMLFPEQPAAVARTLDALISHDRSGEYLCLHRDIPCAGGAGRGPKAQLGRMMEREVVVSDLYLFGDSPFIVDFSDGKTGLRPGRMDRESAGGERDTPSFPFSMLEDAFRDVFSAFPPFRGDGGGDRAAGERRRQSRNFSAISPMGIVSRRFQQDRDDHVFRHWPQQPGTAFSEGEAHSR